MRLKALRENAGMTQKELGGILGVKQNTISQWEAGVKKLRADRLLEIAKVFCCTVDDLLRDDVKN